MLVSCGKEDNSTMESAAKAFMVALIEADEVKIEKLNKSHAWSQPTHYLLQKLSPKFRNTSLSEYTFVLSGGDKIKVIDSFGSGYEFKMLKTSEG
jgi:predicted ATPase